MKALGRFVNLGDEDPRGWLNLRKDCRGKDTQKLLIYGATRRGFEIGEESLKRRLQIWGVWLKKRFHFGVDSLI